MRIIPPLGFSEIGDPPMFPIPTGNRPPPAGLGLGLGLGAEVYRIAVSVESAEHAVANALAFVVASEQ